MATLWKRATPPQNRMLRAIAGAVINTLDHHGRPRDPNFARSVAKRAVGTLTAEWPDVLAATTIRRQKWACKMYTFHAYPVEMYVDAGPDSSHPIRRAIKRGPSQRSRRSPLRLVWKEFQRDMWKAKHGLMTPEDFQANVRILRKLQDMINADEQSTLSD